LCAAAADHESSGLADQPDGNQVAKQLDREHIVKAPSFSYAKPSSLAEVFDLLERHRDGARILAGGQSLLTTLNMRLSAHEVLVDITGVSGLSGVEVRDGVVRIGALTTHAHIERSGDVRKHLPLLAQAVPHIAHAAIRNRGTFGGSVALADPAAEYPACTLALDATFVVQGKQGERRIKAGEFFKGLFETDLRPGEVLVAGEFAVRERHRSVFLEIARRKGDYAAIGLAAHARFDKGRIFDARLALLGAGATPVLAVRTAAALEGHACDAESLATAHAVLAQELDPPADLHYSSAAKLHLARVLLSRALTSIT
jgi:aerobic carbon-monoxide dehydrogenase medium subunit